MVRFASPAGINSNLGKDDPGPEPLFDGGVLKSRHALGESSGVGREASKDANFAGHEIAIDAGDPAGGPIVEDLEGIAEATQLDELLQ